MDKTAVIIVAAVVVVAGAAGALLILSGGDDNGRSASAEGIDYEAVNLMIFGNANNDLTIDEQDKKTIQDIIDGKTPAEGHPLADVNVDGTIDRKDLDEVQRIIDREKGITLHVACYNYANKKAVIDVEYPVKNVGLYGMHTVTSALYTNAGDKVVAYANPSGTKGDYPVMMGSLSGEIISSGMGGSTAIDWKKFMEIDSRTPVGALVIDTAYAGDITAVTIRDFNNAGIPVLAFNGNNVYAQIAATAWIGFLCGPDTERVGKQFAESSQEILGEISRKVSGLKDEQRKSFMTFTMWICVCQNNSPNNSLGELAGGIHYSKVNREFASKYRGNGFSMNLDAETLANFQDCGAYLSIRTSDFGSDFKKLVISNYEFKNASMGDISVSDFMHNAVERLYFINNLLPAALKVAYITEMMYPELFEKGFADGCAQRFIDGGYAPFLYDSNGDGKLDAKQTVSSLLTVMTYGDYKTAKGSA